MPDWLFWMLIGAVVVIIILIIGAVLIVLDHIDAIPKWRKT